MPHLNSEILARLVDEPPDESEATHLTGCEFCRGELEALRAQTAALRQLPHEWEPAPESWPLLEKRLRREGLLRPGRGRSWSPALLRLAAGLALFLAGTALGLSLSGRGSSAEFAGLQAEDGWEAGAVPLAAANPGRSLGEAEAEYLAALAKYAETVAPPASSEAVARLAALESIVLTTRAALRQAPADPVINNYHLTAVAQRDALIRNAAITSDPWY